MPKHHRDRPLPLRPPPPPRLRRQPPPQPLPAQSENRSCSQLAISPAHPLRRLPWPQHLPRSRPVRVPLAHRHRPNNRSYRNRRTCDAAEAVAEAATKELWPLRRLRLSPALRTNRHFPVAVLHCRRLQPPQRQSRLTVMAVHLRRSCRPPYRICWLNQPLRPPQGRKETPNNPLRKRPVL